MLNFFGNPLHESLRGTSQYTHIMHRIGHPANVNYLFEGDLFILKLP